MYNPNSILAKAYRWFYNIKYRNMPTNGCPYFWQSVIMTLCYPFVLIAAIPMFIMEYILEKYDEEVEAPLLGAAALGLIMYGILFLVYCQFAMFFYLDNIHHGIFVAGAFAWGIELIIFISFIIHNIQEYIKRAKRLKKEQAEHLGETIQSSNIVVTFVKAKYNKYCPQLTWNYEKEVTEDDFEPTEDYF